VAHQLAEELAGLREFLSAAAEDLTVEDTRELSLSLRRMQNDLARAVARLAADGPGRP
jgi:hypothetical protein